MIPPTGASAYQPMSSKSNQPLVSVVTPSFNQAQFLRQSIESVLAQGYPNLDYLVVDGGSTDGSLEILRSYGDRIRWISEPDAGQADAIAKGFERTEGEILAWINSDDVLLPNALERVVGEFERSATVGLVYGNGLLIDERGESLGLFPWIEPFDLWRLVYLTDYILQPSAFFRRRDYDAVGGLDTSLHFAMDWDLWIRLAGVCDVGFFDGAPLACSRIWEDTKTSTGGWTRIAELARLARKHTGRRWTPGVRRYAIDTLGSSLRRRLPSRLFRAAGAVGRTIDHRIVDTLPAQPDGWFGPRGELIFPRRWRSAVLRVEVPHLPPRRKARLDLLVDGRHVESRRLRGPATEHFELRPGLTSNSPFCEVELRSTFSVCEPGSRRRLAARLLSLEPSAT